MRAVLTRNILSLDGEQQVPVLAALDDFGDGMGQVDKVAAQVRQDDRKPQKAVWRADACHVAVGEDTQIFHGKVQGQEAPQFWL